MGKAGSTFHNLDILGIKEQVKWYGGCLTMATGQTPEEKAELSDRSIVSSLLLMARAGSLMRNNSLFWKEKLCEILLSRQRENIQTLVGFAIKWACVQIVVLQNGSHWTNHGCWALCSIVGKNEFSMCWSGQESCLPLNWLEKNGD